MKIQGKRDFSGEAVVLVDGAVLLPDASLAVRNHSPTGFAWGYGGSGPAQLALAILLAAGVPRDRAEALYQSFKWEHIAHLPEDGFTLDMDVRAWADARP